MGPAKNLARRQVLLLEKRAGMKIVQKQAIVGGPKSVERRCASNSSTTDLDNCALVLITVRSGRRRLLRRTGHCCSHGSSGEGKDDT
jgi:hypothetical protein